MLRLNTIVKEVKDVPSEHWEEVFEFVHSLNQKTKLSDSSRKKILSYAGSFNDMKGKDYASFVKQIKNTRSNLFERKINL